MFARRLNELHVRLHLAPQSPVLIKEGRHLSDPQAGRALVREFGDYDKSRLPRVFNRAASRYPRQPRRRDGRGQGSYDSPDECFDMAFVWSQTATGPRFYMPGSSLRGVLRSAAERAVSRWSPDWAAAGDPFLAPAQRWVDEQRRAGDSPDSETIYRLSGPIERCFGHTALRGRWSLRDAWMRPDAASEVIVRDSVGIDRRSGAAMAGIKFQFEAITAGIFDTTLTILNFELWQLGLLAYALAALDGGAARLGYGTHRGLGRVRLRVESLEWRWYGVESAPDDGLVRVPPLAELAAQAGLDPIRYGIRDGAAELHLPLRPTPGPFGHAWELTPAADASGEIWQRPPWPEVAALLPAALSGWPIPGELQGYLAPTEVHP